MPGGEHRGAYKVFLRYRGVSLALYRSPAQCSRVVHPLGNGLLMRPTTGGVRPEPRRRGPVAAFAGDAFIQFECLSTGVGRHVKRVAGETLRRLLRLAHAKNPADALAHLARKRLVGLRVLVLDDPNAVLILKNTVIGAGFYTAVATCGAAGTGTCVLACLGG